jgi:hypothetical protein
MLIPMPQTIAGLPAHAWYWHRTVLLRWLRKRCMRKRLQWLRQDSGRGTAAIKACCPSLPASAVLAQRPFSLLGEERAQGGLVESTRLGQTVGLLIGTQGRFGLRPERAIRDAGVKA